MADDILQKLEDTNERVGLMEQDIKKLLGLTQFEKQQYFKYMTDLIKKATSRIDKIDKDWNHLHENYLDELKGLKNKYDESFVEAFDQELYPRIKFRMMDTIKASFAKTLQDYIT